MVVDGLEDGPAEGQQLEVLLHHIDVVGVGVEWRDAELSALGPVVAVVVVDADRRAPVRAQGTDQAARQRRLPRGGVARDGQHDRSWRRCALQALHPHDLGGHRGPLPSCAATRPASHHRRMPAVVSRPGGRVDGSRHAGPWSARDRSLVTASASPPGCRKSQLPEMNTSAPAAAAPRIVVVGDPAVDLELDAASRGRRSARAARGPSPRRRGCRPGRRTPGSRSSRAPGRSRRARAGRRRPGCAG